MSEPATVNIDMVKEIQAWFDIFETLAGDQGIMLLVADLEPITCGLD